MRRTAQGSTCVIRQPEKYSPRCPPAPRRTSTARCVPRGRPSKAARGPRPRRHSASGCCSRSPTRSRRMRSSWPRSRSLDNGKSVMLARHVDMAIGRRFPALHGGLGDQDRRVDARRVGAVHAASEILRVDPQGAGRRRRRDHPVELSAADGRVEDRSCARCRLHRRAEARRGDAADGVAPGRADRSKPEFRRASSTS